MLPLTPEPIHAAGSGAAFQHHFPLKLACPSSNTPLSFSGRWGFSLLNTHEADTCVSSADRPSWPQRHVLQAAQQRAFFRRAKLRHCQCALISMLRKGLPELFAGR